MESSDCHKILAIDIATWEGHHAIYFKKVVSTLVRKGYYVYAACENNLELRKWLTESNINNCTVLDAGLSFSEKVFLKSMMFIDRLISISSKTSLYKFSSIVSVLFARNLLHNIGADIPVFFVDSDTSLPESPLWFTKLLLPSQWMTLAVQPSYRSAISWGKLRSRQRFSAEKAFALPSCKAVLVLHPVYKEFYERCFQTEKFFFLPEIIDVTLSENYDVPAKIEHLAAGRKIISITGALRPKRNLKLLLQAAQYLDPDRFFIAAIGQLPPELYSPSELEEIQVLSSQISRNSYLRFDYYISKDGEFDRLLSISDIVYLQYKNHSFSSNILTKAIYLKKPVIIADNFIMKEVLKRYQWLAVADENPLQVAQTIERLANDFKIDEYKHQEFLAEFSEENFQLAIFKVTDLLNFPESHG
jgi:glycosyltransferase involved in cell wall biosynthesis